MSELKKRFPVYTRVLSLYPASYRKKYEDEILITTADMLDEAANGWAKCAVWGTVAMDLPFNVVRQQYQYVVLEGGRMMPTYVKRNSIIAAFLLAPFFTALIANAIEKLLFGQTLHGSWLWHRPLIGLWVIYFPLLAMLLAVSSYAMYVFNGDKRSPYKRVTELSRSWPLLFTGLAACGILFVVVFHDSGQCWTHAPTYVAAHLSKSWQCSEQNRVDIGRVFRDSI